VYSPIPSTVAALTIVLYLAIAVVLVRKYLRTRDVGFVWLGIAVFIWPLVSGLLEYGERLLIDRLVRGHPVGFYPFTLVEHGQMSAGVLINSLNLTQRLIGACLLLVAALYLSRTNAAAAATQEPNRF